MFTDFEFRDFKPSGRLKHYGQARLTEVSSLSPHAFSALATMDRHDSKYGDVYTCQLELFDEWGLFIAETKSTDPRAAIDGVIRRVQTQIKQWLLRRITLTPRSLWRLSRLTSRNPPDSSEAS